MALIFLEVLNVFTVSSF